MKKHRFALFLLAFAVSVTLCGCGNKGPLVRPAPDAGADVAH